MFQINNPEINNIIGKKRTLPPGTDFSNKTLIISRPSSYGDYFFISPVLDAIRQTSNGCWIVYIANNKLDLEYIYCDPRIDEIIQVTKINDDWQNEQFLIDRFFSDRLQNIINKEDPLVLSYEATDCDYPFGDMSCNAFKHYMEMAGLDFKKFTIARKIFLPDNMNIMITYLHFIHLQEGKYIAFHPFSSQEGRRWTDDRINEFLDSYFASKISLPILLLGSIDEGKDISKALLALDGIYDMRGKSFADSCRLVQLSKFGIFTESCMMHVAQALKTPAINTHLHKWTARFTEPYHFKTKKIISMGEHNWPISLLIDKIKEMNNELRD